jgi:hypothetical protein
LIRKEASEGYMVEMGPRGTGNERRSMRWKAYANLSATIFLVVAIAQLLRVIFGWDVRIGDLDITQWISGLALVVAAVLAYIGYSQRRR